MITLINLTCNVFILITEMINDYYSIIYQKSIKILNTAITLSSLSKYLRNWKNTSGCKKLKHCPSVAQVRGDQEDQLSAVPAYNDGPDRVATQERQRFRYKGRQRDASQSGGLHTADQSQFF